MKKQILILSGLLLLLTGSTALAEADQAAEHPYLITDHDELYRLRREAVEKQPEAYARRNNSNNSNKTYSGETYSSKDLPRKNSAAEEQAGMGKEELPEIAGGNETAYRLSYSSATGMGTLLFSDSPEYVEQFGLLYQDVLNGKGRLYFYHLNEMAAKAKLAVVLENSGDEIVTAKITRRGIGSPSKNYNKVGKGSQVDYFTDNFTDDVYVVGRSRHILDKAWEDIPINKGELVCGIYDVECAAPLKVSVLMCPYEADARSFLDIARFLPRDHVELRGTYNGMDRFIDVENYDTASGAAYIKLADGEEDGFLKGIDASDGKLVSDEGNYGVNYEIKIPTAGSGKIKAYLTPLGGSYAGALLDKTGGRNVVVKTPEEGAFGYKNEENGKIENNVFYFTKEAVYSYLGEYEAGNTIELTYSPPGAANLPVAIILVPERY